MKFRFKIFARVMSFFLVLQVCLPLLSQFNLTSFAQQPSEVKINFQPLGTPMVQDYLPDYGEIFSMQNGYKYGWNVSHTDMTVAHSTYQPDELNSNIRLHQKSYWEISLENGSYEVAVSVGDSVYESTNTVIIEGTTFADHASLQGGEHLLVTKSVSIKDGKLTLGSDDTAEGQTAIQYIVIKKMEEISIMKVPGSQSTDNPRIELPAEPKKVPGDKVLMSGKMNNEHNAPPYIKVRGLKEEIGRYMDAEEQQHERLQADYESKATLCSNCDSAAILKAINSSNQNPVIIKTGHLNLDTSMTLGSSSRPVVLIADGMNANRKLDIDIYGILIIKGNVNANSDLNIHAYASGNNGFVGGGSLWVEGNFHLNSNSSLMLDGQLYAKTLIYNNGQLDVQANRIWIEDQLHINTKVQMNVKEELVAGEIISNNEVAGINVLKGDLFVRNNVHVNNHLEIQTGGWFAMGGDMTANKRPIIKTGNDGETKLKYVLHGLKAEYYSEGSLKGNLYTKVDETVDLSSRPIFPAQGFNDRDFSVRWSGQIEPEFSETYRFEVETRGAVKLWIDDQLLIERWDERYQGRLTGNVPLEAGKRHDIRIEYSSTDSNPKVTLSWESNSQRKEVIPQERLYPFSIPVITAVPTEANIALSWTPAFNADGYELVVDGVVYPLGNLTTFNYENLDSGTLHSFQVRANSGDIIGEWSSIVSVWTLPDIPNNIRLESTSISVRLDWDPTRGATGYDVEYGGMILDNGASTVYLDNELNPNTQRSYRVRAKNSSGPGKWSDIIAKVTLPGIPGDITATATDSSIKLVWGRVAGAYGYDLKVDGVVVDAGVTSYYLHEQLQPYTTHLYQLRSRNSDGVSEWGKEVQLITLPRVPLGITARASSTNEIEVNWSSLEEAEGYELEVDGVPVAVGPSTSYKHSGLSPNSEHTYRARVKNTKATGQWSSKSVVVTPPGTPQNVRASAASGSIHITWEPVLGANGYDIEVDGLEIDNGLNTSYEHTGVTANEQHTYRVRAKNAGGAGEWAKAVMTTTVFGKPLHLAATASSTTITLTWDAVDGATGYDIFYDGEIVNSGSITTFDHTGLTPYSWHVYRVRAKNDNVTGEWSDSLTKVTMLGTPANIRTTPSSTFIVLNWDAVQGATGYDIEADGIAIDNGAATTFVHGNLPPNTEHTYRIRAKNADVVGDWSDWSAWSLPVTGATAPNTPMNVKAVPSPNTITLTWDSVSRASSYEIEVDGQTISGITTTQYIHSGLDPNTMHLYRVRAVNGGARSGWTDVLKKVTTPQLTLNVDKDTMFNFVVVVPKKAGADERKVRVTYDSDAVEVVDLSAITPEIELSSGAIAGTNITVDKFTPGEILFTFRNADKTMTNIIKFISKSNEYSKATYTIE